MMTFLFLSLALSEPPQVPVRREPPQVPQSPIGNAEPLKIKWRADYTSAVAESLRTGKPLLTDIYCVPCGWCDHMDYTTYADPAVYKRVNEAFIPLKLNAAHVGFLVQARQISAYPTVIISAPDGTVLRQDTGFIDAPKFLARLEGMLKPKGKIASTGACPCGIPGCLCGCQDGLPCRCQTQPQARPQPQPAFQYFNQPQSASQAAWCPSGG